MTLREAGLASTDHFIIFRFSLYENMTFILKTNLQSSMHVKHGDDTQNLHIPSPQAEPRNPNVTSPPSPSPRLHPRHYRHIHPVMQCSRCSQDGQNPHLGLHSAVTEPSRGNSLAKARPRHWIELMVNTIQDFDLVPKRGAFKSGSAFHLGETVCASFCLFPADRYRRTMN